MWTARSVASTLAFSLNSKKQVNGNCRINVTNQKPANSGT